MGDGYGRILSVHGWMQLLFAQFTPYVRVHTGRATRRFFEGFLEGSLKEVLLRRALCRRLVRFQ